ncbi:hypothetical protein ACSS6W_001793 [Trichoderma asperelloides]
MVFLNLIGRRPWKKGSEYGAPGSSSHNTQAILRQRMRQPEVEFFLDLSIG